METLIKLLFEKNIVFQVGINNIFFNDEKRQEYFIMLKKSDLKQIKSDKIVYDLIEQRKKFCLAKHKFSSDVNFKDYVFKTLNTFETNNFKNVKHKFKKVLHNENGRVYELK